MNDTARYATRFNDKNAMIVLVCLALTIWVAHFLNFLNFGLYEDDYAVISRFWRVSDFLYDMKGSTSYWWEGRPLGFLILGVLSLIGERVGGLHLIYVIGYLVITLNAFLFYLLLRRVGTETLAIMGALTLCIFPADTTHSFLTHSLSLQLSITYLLAASLLYLSGKRVSPYIVITGSLLTYESPYMVFLAIPLLRAKWDKALVKELLRHVAIMAGIILVAVVIRISLGEGRADEMRADILGVLTKIVFALVIGPAVSLLQFINAPIRAVWNWNSTLTIISSTFVIAFTYMLYRSNARSSGRYEKAYPDTRKQVADHQYVARDEGRQMEVWQLCLVSLIMLALAYTLSFTHYPPVATYGVPASVHLASAIGGSLLFAVICTKIIEITSKSRLRIFAIIIISLYLSLIMAYRVLIQGDFVRAWQNQRSFWANVLDVAPDMREDTLIFVVRKNLPQTNFILSNSWADALVLDQLFNFPDQWINPPRLFIVDRAWFKEVMREGNHFKWKVPVTLLDPHWETIPDYNVILLEMENGRLVRRFGRININGLDLNLKDMPPGVNLNYEKGPLYTYLIGGAG